MLRWAALLVLSSGIPLRGGRCGAAPWSRDPGQAADRRRRCLVCVWPVAGACGRGSGAVVPQPRPWRRGVCAALAAGPGIASVGGVVAVRRRGHRIGWLFLGMGLAAAAQHRWPCVAAVGLPHRNQHLARQSRSERTVATDLIGVRQADALLRANGTILQAATRPIRCGAGSGRSCRTSRSSACPGVHRVWVTLDTSPAQRKVSLNGLCSPPEPQIPEERPLAVPGNAG